MTLPDLLRAYAAGDAGLQSKVLDEVEPLLFGYVHSLTPSGPDARERAIEATHALVIAFHLMVEAGEVVLEDINALKGFAHRLAVHKLKESDEPVRLVDLADPETGSLIHRLSGVANTLRAELDEKERRIFAGRLQGKTLADLARERTESVDETRRVWDAARARLLRCGIVRENA